MTLRDNQTKNTLARDKPIGKYKRVAAKDYHPDCRADLTQIVALHPKQIPPENLKLQKQSPQTSLLYESCSSVGFATAGVGQF
ncbi:MAG: hypothetical protein K0B16_17970 [Burkholderiaceae bacterium]|nr:hypothetical protein [Burkholderiaceae bacterium]